MSDDPPSMPLKNSIRRLIWKSDRRSQTAATKTRRSQTTATIAAFIFFAASLAGSPRETLFDFRLDRAFQIKGLTLPLEDSTGRRVGRLRVEHVSLESAQVGFLRIGVVPQWVLRGIHIIPELDGDCRWTGAFHAFLRRETTLANARIEDFQILTRSGQPLLSARTGGFSQDLGKIFLEKVLIESSVGPRIQIREAEIRLSGRSAGQLRSFHPAGRVINLCEPISPP